MELIDIKVNIERVQARDIKIGQVILEPFLMDGMVMHPRRVIDIESYGDWVNLAFFNEEGQWCRYGHTEILVVLVF